MRWIIIRKRNSFYSAALAFRRLTCFIEEGYEKERQILAVRHLQMEVRRNSLWLCSLVEKVDSIGRYKRNESRVLTLAWRP
jgi:hypothetical protein